MSGVKNAACLFALLLWTVCTFCQPFKQTAAFTVKVLTAKGSPIAGATVELLKGTHRERLAATDSAGIAAFEKISKGSYTIAITHVGYKPQITGSYNFPGDIHSCTITLQPLSAVLQEVSITASKQFIEQKQGKTVLNVDASPTNAGTTVLEVLEKSPGVTVDRNGGIALQGKTGVLVTIDDKPTYLSGDDLNNLLSSMSSAQVDQIELIANPTAKYDASGNAGIINIKTKKNKQKGFNGSFTTSLGQGIYPKNNNSLILNFRSGKFNVFFNYSVNWFKNRTSLYALRKYYDATGNVTSQLEQPTYFNGTVLNNTIKTGFDYYLTPKTTVGMVLSGTTINRDGNNVATAKWLDPTGVLDSAISTTNQSKSRFRNGAINVNGRHVLSASQDLSIDLDLLHYNNQSDQSFDNHLLAPGGYDEQSRGNIPTTINILSGKIDYTLHPSNVSTFHGGLKSSHSSTDNSAAYQNFIGTQFVDDNTKSNHFIYQENIHAVYADIETKYQHLTVQAGVRYEHTGYNANQLGNAIQKDSAFTRNYGGFFPSGYISYQADTANSFTLSVGRRIDRPVFQTLNPFYFIINKYTYSTGNPYLLPQYSWNLQLSHQYKNLLTTAISYSIIQNYFSQIFLADTSRGVLLYTQGNVGHTYNLGMSATLTVSPLNWWSITTQAIFNHKQLAGFNGNTYKSEINQLNLNMNNQFSFAKVYTAELTGVYTTRARNDIQELLYPTGQVSVGISKPVLHKKATLKFSARDIFHTNAMEGLTQFPNATEYFKLVRDSRVFTLAFSYRFGKAYKTGKHSEGSAADEAARVGNG